MSRPLAEYTPYESDEETGDEKTEELGTEDESGTEDEYVAEEDPNELRRIRQARDARYALIRAPTDGPLLTDEPLPAITRVLRSNIINTPTGAIMTGTPGVVAPVTGAIKNVTVDPKKVATAAHMQAMSKTMNLLRMPPSLWTRAWRPQRTWFIWTPLKRPKRACSVSNRPIVTKSPTPLPTTFRSSSLASTKTSPSFSSCNCLSPTVLRICPRPPSLRVLS